MPGRSRRYSRRQGKFGRNGHGGPRSVVAARSRREVQAVVNGRDKPVPGLQEALLDKPAVAPWHPGGQDGYLEKLRNLGIVND